MNDDDKINIEKEVEEALIHFKNVIVDYSNGNHRALNFIVGKIITKINGKYDAKDVRNLLIKKMEQNK